MRIGSVEMPHELRIVRGKAGEPGRLYIDGKLFEFATADGFHVDVRRSQMPGVTLTLVAESVLVSDKIFEETADDDAECGPAPAG